MKMEITYTAQPAKPSQVKATRDGDSRRDGWMGWLDKQQKDNYLSVVLENVKDKQR